MSREHMNDDNSELSGNESGISDILPPSANKEPIAKLSSNDLSQSIGQSLPLNGPIDELVAALVRELVPKIEVCLTRKIDEAKDEILQTIGKVGTDTVDVKELCTKISEMSISSSKWIKASTSFKAVSIFSQNWVQFKHIHVVIVLAKN